MTSQKDYWDKKITEWSSASYGRKSSISFLEKVATYFRSVDKRKDAAIKIISPLIKNKVILDLGCGLGEFAFGILRYKPKKVIALDISPNAVKQARLFAKKKKIHGKVRFEVSDVVKTKKLPESDIVIGLGFIDYLTLPQLKNLFRMIGKKPYLFSCFEKKFSLFNLLHNIYLISQNCPGAYKHTRSEIRNIVPKGMKLSFITKDGLLFITNLHES
ncbi:hypothetical protein A3G67_03185 [Candidatus Roizmanbacteria bacterium RIFCSPLOWO2_12_FULL_40_12]|uniref:Methyltransferase domain-containing protein n=1 Tax=Candidatus Roizmanbacteria bacterium RIFCSPLOWO2_01_FULL_40_42 TaxID=1802066 RepID=A0A1F7J5E9_9BACT|nr:MAG: hypothetical protein A2779_02820 [Candidatus Roizmanbacteria bacterium RIFCSPHIGHO2_01_FULL_40_98]OGK28274.1 MAG: hypothetical protein A3C31_00185 [Candidatus Roizmanbacteria bacterium RIFCSPHIGHO2_02_FULL_40_53]OGK30510.1 MAG: hypothetical protein A2W49_02870 [Candidatus Roizmanbacteria bacterium RIFCSPHIGHO2_12_41_18]OGK36924.1 MAG: hypothetical protein A3E69_00445 [Candidatus Roizmanbacteria bacterium RIFCSPHIGHO2_12_FULL_40_130]OGK50830.1 MAG: hypothetical protein A3B50_00955 [Candi